MALPVVVGLLAAALVLLGNAEYGPGGLPDSVVYLGHMAQLKAGALHPDYTPPGFAIVCHVVRSATGLSPIASAGLVNAAAFGLTVFVTLLWLRRLGVSHLVCLWFGVTAAVSPLAAIAGDVMTESLFIFLIAVTLFALDRVLAGNKRFLTLACLAAAGAGLTRLAGVAAIAAGVLVVLTAGGGSLAKRVRIATIFVAAAGAPVAVWGITVFDPGFHRQGSFDAASMVLSPVRAFVDWTFGREAAWGESALTRWIDFSSSWLAPASLLGVLLVFLATFVLPALWIHIRHGSSLRGGWEGWKGGWAANTLFLAVYAATLAAMCWFSGIGPPPRYFLPMYLPGLFVLALVLQTLISHVSHEFLGLQLFWRGLSRRDLGLFIAAAAGLIVLVTWQCVRLPALVAQKHEYVKANLAVGRALSSKLWEESKTMAYVVETLRPGSTVWTNQRSAVIWHIDPLFDRFERVRHWPDLGSLSDQSHLLAAEAGSRVNYLVWFHHVPGRRSWPWRWTGFCELQQPLDSLIEAEALQPLAAFEDGVVFQVPPSPPPPRTIYCGRGSEGCP